MKKRVVKNKSIWTNYIGYVSDNPKGYWFKRKLYGWGWVPVTWQGVTITLGFILLLLINGFYLEYKVLSTGNPTSTDLAIFIGIMTISIIAMLRICYVKGEKPKWSWGR